MIICTFFHCIQYSVSQINIYCTIGILMVPKPKQIQYNYCKTNNQHLSLCSSYAKSQILMCKKSISYHTDYNNHTDTSIWIERTKVTGIYYCNSPLQVQICHDDLICQLQCVVVDCINWSIYWGIALCCLTGQRVLSAHTASTVPALSHVINRIKQTLLPAGVI